MKIREIQADDYVAIGEAVRAGYVLVRSYLRPGAEVRTLVYEMIKAE